MSSDSKILSVAGVIAGLFVKLPLWLYIMYNIVKAVNVPGLMMIFGVYALVSFFVGIVKLIAEASSSE